ncbi:hypothetical protein I79_014983 [Cricetulus griseus]|uniref:Uncharacterized protein n=1 Tax=Cricetulus griseus TaxID=10029 RepID=G3HVJ4_CRIGR|nr:hypothetical protein I79_014983 [Cricetulus griseus]
MLQRKARGLGLHYHAVVCSVTCRCRLKSCYVPPLHAHIFHPAPQKLPQSIANPDTSVGSIYQFDTWYEFTILQKRESAVRCGAPGLSLRTKPRVSSHSD